MNRGGNDLCCKSVPKPQILPCRTRRDARFRAQILRASASCSISIPRIRLVGVSKDSQASHKRFAEKNSLPFTLLSDPELSAIQAYDVWKEKKLYGKVSMGVVRTTYVIDADGTIVWAKEKVKPDQNAQEILDFLTGK